MKINYIHNNLESPSNYRVRSTIAYQDFNTEEFIQNLHDFQSDDQNGALGINLMLGYSLVHPDDQYIKRYGREIAEDSMKVHPFKMLRILYMDGYDHYTLQSFDNNYKLSLTLKIYQDSKRLRVVGCNVERL
jgi:hypothetical protein